MDQNDAALPGMGPQIVDFDKLAPDKRLARIGGRVIDVTTIPARVTLELAQFADQQKDQASDGAFTRMLELVAKIASQKDAEITADWLLDHTTVDALLAFTEFVLEPLKKRAKKGGGGEAPAAESEG